jgi:acyl carrier protein
MTTDLPRTRAVLTEALGEVLNRELADLDDDTRLLGGLGLDSTSIIELLVAIEDSLGVQFDPDNLTIDVFQTFGTLVAYVTRCAAEQADSAQEPVG